MILEREREREIDFRERERERERFEAGVGRERERGEWVKGRLGAIGSVLSVGECKGETARGEYDRVCVRWVR